MLLAACSPVKIGSAAIVGDQRITSSSLDTDVSNLQQGISQYASGAKVNPAVLPKLVLGQLISFQVRDRTAQDLGVTVTQADINQAIDYVYQSAVASGNSFTSPEQMIIENAVPLELAADFGRYYAVELAYLKAANGGKVPTSNTPAVTKALSEFSSAECRAAKALSIQVNPQYGQLGFDQTSGFYQVTAPADTLSAASGAKPVSATPFTPAC